MTGQARSCGDKDRVNRRVKSQISWQPLKNTTKQNKTKKASGPPNLLPADSRRTAGTRQPSDWEMFGNRPGGSLPIPSPRPLPSSQCADAPRGPVRRPATQKASPGTAGRQQGHKERLKLKLLFFFWRAASKETDKAGTKAPRSAAHGAKPQDGVRQTLRNGRRKGTNKRAREGRWWGRSGGGVRTH